MSDTTHGNSVILESTNETKSAFGVPVSEREAIAEDTDHTPEVQESEEKVESETQAEETQDEEETSEGEATEEVVEEDAEMKKLKKQASESHKMVIDAIDSKYALLESGTLSESELKQWFKDHPEFDRVANKSKRLKEKHRTFMEAAPVKKQEVTQEDDSESYENEDDKPMTFAEYKRLEKEREDKQMETGLQRERNKQAETYAIKYQILDSEFTALQKSAEALYNVHDEWTFEDALKAAKNALYPNKNKPINPPSKGQVAPQIEDDEDIDLEMGTTIRL